MAYSEHKNVQEKTIKEIRYSDCLSGKAEAPRAGIQRVGYQTITTALMAAIMVIFKWVAFTTGHSTESFFLAVCLYPTLFAITLGIRLLIANPVLDRFAVKVIAPRVKGIRKALCVSLSNASFMGIATSIAGSAITGGSAEISVLGGSILSLPVSCAALFVLEYFCVAPLTKKAIIRSERRS